jgi:hypothetical protein
VIQRSGLASTTDLLNSDGYVVTNLLDITERPSVSSAHKKEVPVHHRNKNRIRFIEHARRQNLCK